MKCPNCGFEAEDWNGEVPCPTCKRPPALSPSVSDAVTMSEEFTAEHRRDTKLRGVRSSGDSGRSIAVDLTDIGEQSGLIDAPPRPGETGTPEVCERLRHTLNDREGGSWERCECNGTHGTDCVLYAADGQELHIQVTRAVPGQTGIWKPVQGQINSKYEFSREEASEHLRSAIESKANHYSSTERAVDVIETPAYVGEDVVQRLDAEWLADAGFKAIWLVGITPSLSVRLHPAQ
jgi:hypothetical protein